MGLDMESDGAYAYFFQPLFPDPTPCQNGLRRLKSAKGDSKGKSERFRLSGRLGEIRNLSYTVIKHQNLCR